jgi:membrane protein implicated in regulation of membrane protease activity
MELWLILFLGGLGLIGLELIVPIMFWMPLGLAAIATSSISYFFDHWSVLGIWPILNFILLFIIKNYFSSTKQQKYKSGVDSLIGLEGVVVEKINCQGSSGKVKVNAEVWNVRSATSDIAVSEKVKIVSVSGNQVDVEEIIDFKEYLEKNFDRELNK